MPPLLLALLVLPGLVLGAFVAYESVFALASFPFLRRCPTRLAIEPTARFAIIVPACDEAKLIQSTVRSLLDVRYPPGLREVIVVADNCTDDTAALARQAGAICHERVDPERHGKPHALKWAIDRLDLDRYDALVIIDADTVVDRGFLMALAAHLDRGTTALQGYFGVRNPDETWLTRLGILPATIRFRLQYPGKAALGLSCPLAGNGMCFSAGLIRTQGWTAFSITENWEYYVQLALKRVVVSPAVDAVVYSQVARTLKLGEAQRSRWMRGRIDTLRRYGRPLLVQGLTGPSLIALDALVELARPSHSMLMFWSLVYLVACTGAWAAGLSGAALLLAGAMALLAAQVILFVAALALDRPPLRTWLALVMVPWYLIWKFMVSLKGLRSLSQHAWIKTTRN